MMRRFDLYNTETKELLVANVSSTTATNAENWGWYNVKGEYVLALNHGTKTPSLEIDIFLGKV